jgi:alpha/beta hydrolase family protein
VTEGLFPAVSRNPDAIALGGVRTPPVDVPAVVLSGEPGPTLSAICLLIGSSKPLTAARLAALYPSRADYVQRYAAAADAAVGAGFILAEDRPALIGYSKPQLVAG